MFKLFKVIGFAWLFIALLISFAVIFSYNFTNFVTGDGVNQGVIFHLFTSNSGINLLFMHVQEISIAITGFVLSIFFIIYILKQYYFVASRSIVITFSVIISIFVIINPFSLAIWRGYVPQNYDRDDSLEFTTSFKDYYINSDLVEIKKKKNVVMIYLESFESIFLDNKYYPADMASGLRSLRDTAAYNYNNIIASSGLSDSAASFLASQCGVPFFDNVNGSKISRNQIGLFINTICLGDIFKYNQYITEMLSAAYQMDIAIISFMKRHFLNYFSPLSMQNIILSDIKKGNLGLLDASFFAKKVQPRYEELLEQNSPFFLTVVGISTHSPNGEVDTDYCSSNKYKTSIMNALHCTDKAAAKMIQHMIDKSVVAKKDTLIVVMSDHYMMSGSRIFAKAKSKVDKTNRRNLLFVIDTGKLNQPTQQISKSGSYVDLAATLLIHYLGVDIPGFGLGKNLHGQDQTTVEIFAAKGMSSPEYYDWLPDIYKLHTSINIQNSAISLTGKNNYNIKLNNIIVDLPLFVNCNNNFNYCIDKLQKRIISKKDSQAYIGNCQLLNSILVLEDLNIEQVCLLVTKNGQLYYKKITKEPFLYKQLFNDINKIDAPIRAANDLTSVINNVIEMHKITLPYVKSNKYQFTSAVVNYIRNKNRIYSSVYEFNESSMNSKNSVSVAIFGINQNGKMLKLRSMYNAIDKNTTEQIGCKDLINKQLLQKYTEQFNIKALILYKPYRTAFCDKKNKNDLHFLVKDTPFNTADVDRDESYIGVWVPETDYLYELKKDKTLILDILPVKK